MTLLGRHLNPCLLVAAVVGLAFAVVLIGSAGAGASAPAKPTGYWKLFVKLELTSTGTATNPRCYPDPEQVAPSPVSGSATQTVVWKTTRPTTVEFHETPGGIRNWKGFRIEPEQTPGERWESCGLAGAQLKLDPLDLEITASRGQLTGKAPTLVFTKTRQLKASDTNEGIKSSATGTLKHTVTLIRASSSS